jgi:hypothetical protein
MYIRPNYQELYISAEIYITWPNREFSLSNEPASTLSDKCLLFWATYVPRSQSYDFELQRQRCENLQRNCNSIGSASL